jgi:hypothetical protein
MALCLLVFYPASRLDGLVLAPIAAGTISAPAGIAGAPLGHAAGLVRDLSVQFLDPLVALAAAAGLAALCLTGRWKPREPDPGPGPAPAWRRPPPTTARSP